MESGVPEMTTGRLPRVDLPNQPSGSFRRHISIKRNDEESSALIRLLVPQLWIYGDVYRESRGRGQLRFTEDSRRVSILESLGPGCFGSVLFCDVDGSHIR